MSGIIAIIIAEVIWGAAPAIFKYSLQEIPPFTLAFIRFFGAAILLLPFALSHWKKLSGREWLYILLATLVGVFINISAFFVGLERAPSINVNMIGAIGPLVLYVLSVIILHEKPHAQVLKGMLIALIGVLVIFIAPLLYAGAYRPDGSAGSVLFGNFLFVIAMLGAILYVVINKKIIKTIPIAELIFIQFFIGSLTFIPMMSNELQAWSFSSLTQSGWIGIIYGIFFASILGYVLFNYALKRISAQQMGIFEYIKPVIAVVVAIPLLGEIPDIYFYMGSVLIFVGVYISKSHPHYHAVHRKMHGRE